MDSRRSRRSGDSSSTWDLLVRHVETFIEQWEGGTSPPKIAAHLPEATPALRKMTLVELVKVDLDYRWRRQGTHKHLEEYLAEFAELADDKGPPVDLIYEELHVRRQSGLKVDPSEYFARFPQQADALRRLLGANDPHATTTLVPTRRLDEVSVGDRLEDFDLVMELGRGAFATVYLARQRSMQRMVALKVSADRGSEPQTLANLDHPHIVRVYDQRIVPDRKMRLLYMQYVAGGTLHDVIDELANLAPAKRNEALFQRVIDDRLEAGGLASTVDGPTRKRQAETRWPEVVCRVGAQLALALDYAHRQGVLHRDVKPANVLLAADGKPKLADFNISFSSQVQGATPASYFGGSLAYMSPEQLEACNPHHERAPDELDGRSDLYSLAVMLWELLYGERPWWDQALAAGWNATLVEMTGRRRAGPPAPPEHLTELGETGLALHGVLQKCLSPWPEDRPATGADLAREFLLCLNPRTQQLLHVPEGSWRAWVRNHAILAVLAAVLLPNILAGIFNYFYNEHEIITRLEAAQAAADQQPGHWDVQAAFWNVQLVINAIAFPLGALIGMVLLWPLSDRLQLGSAAPRGPPSPEEFAWLRRRALWMGVFSALIGIFEWAVAGVAYPVSLQLLTGTMDVAGYIHFALSMAVCGLIAAAYPFFFVTLMSTRIFYPALLQQGPPDPDESTLLLLSRLCDVFLLLAAGVPMAGVAMLAFTDSENKTALVVLSLLAGAGFGLAFYLNRAIQADLLALRLVAAPTESLTASTDSLDTTI